MSVRISIGDRYEQAKQLIDGVERVVAEIERS